MGVPMAKRDCSTAGVLVTAIFLASGAVAYAQKPNKPGPPPKEDRERVNCIIISKYDPDTPPELRGPGGKATNQDRKDAAAALKGQYDHEADKTKTPTEVNEVNDEYSDGKLVNTYDNVFANLKQQKKCCRRLDILAHGETDGTLQLPYNMPVTPEELKEGGIPPRNEIGGPNGKTGVGRKWLEQFSSQVKSLLCPDPTPKNVKVPVPPVSLYACYTSDVDGSNGSPVTMQLAHAIGANVRGYTKSCDYHHDDDKPTEVFNPTGETATYDPHGNIVGEPSPDDTPKKDEPKKDEAKKPEPRSVDDGSHRNAKGGSKKATKTATQPGSPAKPDDHAMSPDASRALGTAIGIGVGIGLGMGRGGGDRDMMRHDR